MRAVEDPFVSRDAVVASFRFGAPSTDAPFRALRRRGFASRGIGVPLRATGGRLGGRLQLYSAVNLDAARAARFGLPDVAAQLAAEAGRLESLPAASVIRAAVERAALEMSTDEAASHQSGYRDYLAMRRHESWLALDEDALMRAWLVNPAAWLNELREDAARVREAVEELAEATDQVRDGHPTAHPGSLTSFVGVVRRMDPSAVELRAANGEGLLVPRRDLEREGLAVPGQGVTILREELTAGRVITFAAPAAILDPVAPVVGFDPFDGPLADVLAADESRWLERILALEPEVAPVQPLAFLPESGPGPR